MSATLKKELRTLGAPAPLPFYSQGVVIGNIAYVSGSLGIDSATGKFVEGTVADRTVSRLLVSDETSRMSCKTWNLTIFSEANSGKYQQNLS